MYHLHQSFHLIHLLLPLQLHPKNLKFQMNLPSLKNHYYLEMGPLLMNLKYLTNHSFLMSHLYPALGSHHLFQKFLKNPMFYLILKHLHHPKNQKFQMNLPYQKFLMNPMWLPSP
jgi:hypothetical protein